MNILVIKLWLKFSAQKRDQALPLKKPTINVADVASDSDVHNKETTQGFLLTVYTAIIL